MSHLTVEQLVELREPGLEPGLAEARTHLAGCAACQAEATRLDQRAARLRALPSLRPARDRWPVLAERLSAQQRQRRLRWVLTGLATAACLALVVGVRSSQRPGTSQVAALDEAMTRSRQLEQLIQAYNPDARVTDGRTVRVAGELEDRIAVLDRELELAQLMEARQRDETLLRLWRQRVGLLDALVDVHLTRASAVGF